VSSSDPAAGRQLSKRIAALSASEAGQVLAWLAAKVPEVVEQALEAVEATRPPTRQPPPPHRVPPDVKGTRRVPKEPSP
jgi:hypothetical protein